MTLPEPAEVLTNEDLISELVDEGLSFARSEELSNRLNTLQRLADWYYQESGRISEHEIRAYLVWPLLQVLGWSEQCVKFEWINLDLALLEKTYTEDNQNQIPIVIGETKRLFSGLSLARKQAEDSLKKIFGRTGK